MGEFQDKNHCLKKKKDHKSLSHVSQKKKNLDEYSVD